MNSLFFILRKTLKNNIKELKKKPAALISYVLIALFMVFLIVSSFLAPNRTNQIGSTEYLGAIITALLLLCFFTSAKQGIEKGSSFFRAADVNLVFTAPISPQRVLIYGFLKQISKSVLAVFFLMFQIPNLQNIFNIDGVGILVIVFGSFLFILSLSYIGMLIYSISSKSKDIRAYFNKGFNFIIGAIAVLFLFHFSRVRDVKIAILTFLNSKTISFIPYIGWFKELFMSAVNYSPMIYVYLILIIIFIGVIAFCIYKLDVDYYEDVLDATDRIEKIYQAKKEGKGFQALNNRKVRKVSQVYKGQGAVAIYYRQILEYRKVGFLFINITTIIFLIGGIVAGVAFKELDLKIILYFSIYMLFFFTFAGKWPQELTKPYIYLIPASSVTKIIYATLADVIKYLVDGLMLFITIGIMMKANIFEVVLCGLCYASFGMIYTYSDIFSRRFLGATHSKALEMFIRILIILFIVVPNIGLSIFITLKGQIIISYLVMIAYNLFISLIIVCFSKEIFEQLEMQ